MREPPWNVITLQSVVVPEKPGLMVIAELAKIAPGFFPNDAAPRVYSISNTTKKWSPRGGHYHPEGGKRELIIALKGTIEFSMHSSDGCGFAVLESPQQGLLIPNGIWHGVRMSPGAILLSIASTLYTQGESITSKPCGCP